MKENMPLVSVIVPCYNHEKYVEQTIESIINQTYRNIELIVIDDGSQDKSQEVLQELSDKYNFYFEHQVNIGLSATLNKALKMCKGKYLSICASDDIMLANKIEVLVGFLENSSDDYAVVFGDAIFINDKNYKINVNNLGYVTTKINEGFNSFLDFYTNQRHFDYKNEQIFGSYDTLLGGNYLPAMSQVIKTDIVRNIGGWREGNMIEDWEMWLKLSKKYKFKYIDETVALYRLHEGNAIKIYKTQLEIDAIKLLIQEKSYAIDNNLKAIWELNYFYKLIEFIKNKKILLFFKYFDLTLVYSFSIFLMKKIIKKVLKLN